MWGLQPGADTAVSTAAASANTTTTTTFPPGIITTSSSAPLQVEVRLMDDYRLALSIGSVVSAMASLFFISRYLFCKRTRHHLTELIQFRSVFDALYSVAVVVLLAIAPSLDCTSSTLVLQVLASGSEIYAFILSVDVVLAIVDPFTNFKTRRWLYFVGAWLAAVGCGALVWIEAISTRVGSSVSPLFGCGALANETTPLNSTNAAFWIEANIPAIVMYIASFCNLVAALCWLSRGIRLSDALAARRSAIKAGTRYLAGYFVYWLLIRVLFLHIKLVELPSDWWEYMAHAVLISSRGVVTLFLWSLGTRPVRSCCGLRTIRTTAGSGGGDHGGEGLGDTHTILRQELLFYTKLGITVSVKHARKQRARRRSGGIEAFKFALPAPLGAAGGDPASNRGKSHTLFSPASTSTTQARRTLDHKRSHSALPTASSSAAEPLLATSPSASAVGGGVAAAAKRRMQQRQQRLAGERGGGGTGGGAGVGRGGGGHDDGTPMSALVASTESTADPGTVSSDVRWKTSLKATKGLIDGGSQVERSADMAGGMPWHFTDFCPQVFADIRRLCGVEDAGYVDALRYTSNEKFTSSASGSFFFFSRSRRFIVKTASKAECKFLLSIIGHYTLYLRDNPDTLLPKFFGCHSIKLYQREIFFVVMNNVFANHTDTKLPLHVFDLKGSTVKRRELPERGGAEWLADGSTVFGKTLKDLDFFRFDGGGGAVAGTPRSKLPPPPRGVSHRIKAQLARDCEWLREHAIMDYSLLLGVSIDTPQRSPSPSSAGAGAPVAVTIVATAHATNGGSSDSSPTTSVSPLPPLPSLPRHALGRGALDLGEHAHRDAAAGSVGVPGGGAGASTSAAGSGSDGEQRQSPPPLPSTRPRRRRRHARVSMPSGIAGWVNVVSADAGTSSSSDGGGGGGGGGGAGAGTAAGAAAGTTTVVSHLGLIDILQRWDCGKKAESCGKVRLCCLPAGRISAVNSVDYEQRFLRRVVEPLLGAGPAAAAASPPQAHAERRPRPPRLHESKAGYDDDGGGGGGSSSGSDEPVHSVGSHDELV